MRKAIVLLAILVGCNEQPTGTSSPSSASLRLTSTGEEVFTRVFTDSTGLGPLFNGPSCAECHESPLGGSGDEIERHQSIDCAVTVLHEFPTSEPSTGEIGLRSSNDLFGLGHLDQLSDAQIIAYITTEPRFLGFIDGQYWFNSPRLSLINGQVGKFGRKANTAHLSDFVRGALRKEIGIEPSEISESDVLALIDFVQSIQRPAAKTSPRPSDPPGGFKRFLVPPGRIKTPRDSVPSDPGEPPSFPDSVEAGRAMFISIGCAVCHNPSTEYTDLALHSLDESDICDKSPDALSFEEGARFDEFRTEPLTGLGLQTRFMHDGASTLTSAIDRHNGEGGFSKANFNHLADRQRALILAFLRSL